MIFKAAFSPLQASKYSNLKISSLSKQFSFTKIQSFSFREEKCFFVWSYDKNISTFWHKRTFTNCAMYALMQKFTLIVSLSQSDSNLKSKREHQIAIENTTSSYRFDELFLRIVKIEHRIDQDVSSINSLIKKKLVEAQIWDFFFVYCCHLCALGGPIYRHWGGP